MTQAPEVLLEVGSDQITARIRGTAFCAVYYREEAGMGLSQSKAITKDSSAGISTKEFEKLAWEAALKKARELGWIAEAE